MSRSPSNSPDQPLGIGHSALVIPRRRRGGFALLITITLLAFLVLLLVSLAALTRVETQVAANSQQVGQARQNALMALNIALGQLQKYAGPDQRTTARADLENGAAVANPHWIGVYGSSVRADYDTTTPATIAVDLSTPANLTSTGSPARLLNWLVSGNEAAPFDPAWGAPGHVGTRGEITAYPAAADIPFNPATAVTTGRQLVGSNSVASPADYVVAPAVAIQVAASSVPGAGASGTVTVGRYAWWVGDEGMKARVNLPLAGTDTSLTSAEKQEQQRNAFFNSSRAAIELMAKADNTWPPAATIGTDYTPGQSLKKVTAVAQTPLTSTNSNPLATALKHRFHDVTANSVSLLTDTYAGGLKRDLSILLASSPAPSDPTADSNRLWVPQPAQTGVTNADSGVFPYGTTTGVTISGFGIPTWKHLRSYYQTRVPTGGAQPFSMMPQIPAHDKSGETDHVGVAPVITYYSIGWRMAPTALPAAGTEIHMNLHPLVVLWNPYNFTLKAPPARADGSNYEVGILPTFEVTVALEVETTPGTWTKRGLFNFKEDTSPVANHVAKHKFIRFRLRCPDIPPGQSLIFSLPHTASGSLYTQRNILENIEPEESAYLSVPFRSVTSATVAATIQPGEENLLYRVGQHLRASDNFNYSASFRPGGNGGMNIYLGEPDDISHVLAADWVLDTRPGGARQLLNPSTSGPSPFPNRRWYNAHQNVGWDNNAATSVFQGPEQLVYDTAASQPVYVFLTQALFSGHGWNAQLNLNQFMFTTRWIAQGNMRAVRSGRTRRDGNYNPLYTASAGSPSLQTPWQKFNIGNTTESHRTSAGKGHDWIGNAPVNATLFEFPYENQTHFSIAQLQHANLSFFGAYPSYPIGNSLADYRLRSSTGTDFPTLPSGHQLVRTDRRSSSIAELASDQRGYYDISYLLNRTLWDRYYFSTVPATGAIPQTLANSRHVRRDSTTDLQNPDRSASALLLEGGFNVNSTSEQAWRAILGAVNQLPFDPENPDSATAGALRTAFTRFSRPSAGDDPADAWKGYRTLSDNQVAQLARNLVTEIRNRGPFVSLADFVNRRLVDNTGSTDNNEIYRGPLQSAIDRTAAASTSAFPTNDPSPGSFWAGDELAVSSGAFHNQGTQYTLGYWEQGRLEGRMNATTAAAKSAGNRSAFAPKYVSQADLLATIGSSLTARSDTFTVRTYGETVNPATQQIEGRAWCEAVVQRLPEHFTGSVDPWATPAAGSTDQTFGRRFLIISFRWLSPTDI